MRGAIGVRFQRSDRALSRRVGRDVLVALPDQTDVHALGGGASAVWSGLAVPRTLPELVARLAEAHGVAGEEIASEVEESVEALLGLHVVEEVQEFDG